MVMKELKLTPKRIFRLQNFFEKCDIQVKSTDTGCQIRFYRPQWNSEFWGGNYLLTNNEMTRVRDKIFEAKQVKLDCWATQSFDNKKEIDELYLALLPAAAGKDFKIPKDKESQLAILVEGLKVLNEEGLVQKSATDRLISLIVKDIEPIDSLDNNRVPFEECYVV